MGIFNKIKEMRLEARLNNFISMAYEEIKLGDWNDEIYIFFRNIPIKKTNNPIQDLNEIRELYISFLNKPNISK